MMPISRQEHSAAWDFQGMHTPGGGSCCSGMLVARKLRDAQINSRQALGSDSSAVTHVRSLQMKRLMIASALAVLAFGPIACNKSEPGGPNPSGADSFKLEGGTIPSSIKQGDTESIKVSVDRSKGFHHTVKLNVNAPDKLKAELDRTTVKDGEPPDVNVRVTPSADAPPGDYKLTVNATPDTGVANHLELTVKVAKK